MTSALGYARGAAALLLTASIGLAAACSASTPPDDTVAPGDIPTSDPSSGDGNEKGTDKDPSDVPATDGGLTDATSPIDGAADAQTAAKRYWPSFVGQTMTYLITNSNVASYPNGTRTSTVLSKGTFVGRSDVYQITDAFRVPQQPFYHQEQGTEIIEHYDPSAPTPAWTRALDDNVVTGHTWASSPGVTMTYTTMPSITVPAGTFTDCVKIERTPGTVRAYLCRGVGMVKQEVNQGGYTFNADLTAKNF